MERSIYWIKPRPADALIKSNLALVVVSRHLYASGELKFVAISRMLSLSTSFISMGEGRVYAEHSRI